jgi:EAL domain-containing protein (putative c-di-GMP-specific phosphodiesterase class I)
MFHIDKLKIDQVFIRDADLEGRDGAIISSIIDMCHKLQIEAVAEGVETETSLNFLKERGCHQAQGFYLSPPLPVEEAGALLEKRR